MDSQFTQISVKGKWIKVPSVSVGDRTVVATGRWVRIAVVHQEEWMEGEPVQEAENFIKELKAQNFNADIFCFSQRLPDTIPKYKYHVEWDNVAAIPITNYDDWWQKRLPQVTRKSVRRGNKRGVVAKVAQFDDELVNGIIRIHNSTLMKQGVPFAHFGKNFDVVKKEYGTYLERSEFLGAYYQNELIGIIKLVYMGEIASILQIISKEDHYDKRPANILIAKAVEVCEKKGMSFLIYGKYIYGKKTKSSLTEFKRRSGFEQIDFPRYYIPLTLKGRTVLRLKLHLGLKGILPAGIIYFLLDLRSRYYHIKKMFFKSVEELQIHSGAEGLKDRDREGR
jgi:hypothetical protein